MQDVIASISRIFRDAGLEYVLIGGHAVNTWLEPRFTADIDVTVQADAAAVERRKSELGRQGYGVAAEYGAGVPSGPDFVRFESSDQSVRIEIQTAKTQVQREAIRRGIERAGVRVATPEDLLVMKLIAHRSKDQIDASGLARLEGLDWPYVERWAAEWDVTDRLRALRSD